MPVEQFFLSMPCYDDKIVRAVAPRSAMVELIAKRILNETLVVGKGTEGRLEKKPLGSAVCRFDKMSGACPRKQLKKALGCGYISCVPYLSVFENSCPFLLRVYRPILPSCFENQIIPKARCPWMAAKYFAGF